MVLGSKNQLTLEDVLDLQYISQWKWSPSGKEIGCIMDDGGFGRLWVYERTGEDRKCVAREIDVSSFDWHPDGGRMVFVGDESLYLAEWTADEWEIQRLTQTRGKEQVPRYSPDGSRVAFVRDEELWIWNLSDGRQSSVAPRKGTVVSSSMGGSESIIWSPCGERLAFHFSDPTMAQFVGVCDAEGDLIWQSHDRCAATDALAWLDDDRLLIMTNLDRSTVAEFRLVDFGKMGGEVPRPPDVRLIHVDRALGTPGSLRATGAWPEPGGERVLFRSEEDGWAHLYLMDLVDGEFRQVTCGEGEDLGYVGDEPRWAPRGRYVCYSSNLGNPGERQLWLLDANTEEFRALTAIPGTNVSPSWCPDGSPTLAFVHCDAKRSADIWVADLPQHVMEGRGTLTEGNQTSRVTRTMPDIWSEDLSIVPREITYESAGGLPITGYLLCPPDFDDTAENEYPALVWVHGGPVRQMRPGFHPSRPYALFHAFSQYLAHKGYVTLEINFRGGIGYGREFRNALFRKMGVDDVKDVVEGGRYLKDLPYVDPERVAVWGLSYGGYMTLTALTKYPDEFAMGVNVAGVYDFVQWTHWIQDLKGPWSGNFSVFFDGDPEESPDTYYHGSPCNFIENMNRPLVSLQGTADMNVDFAQLDRIVKDCLSLEKDHDAHYYPDEVHSFERRESWADAFVRIEDAFDRHLKE